MHWPSLVLWDASPNPLRPLEVLSLGMSQLPRLLTRTCTNSKSMIVSFGTSFFAAAAMDGDSNIGAAVIAWRKERLMTMPAYQPAAKPSFR